MKKNLITVLLIWNVTFSLMGIVSIYKYNGVLSLNLSAIELGRASFQEGLTEDVKPNYENMIDGISVSLTTENEQLLGKFPIRSEAIWICGLLMITNSVLLGINIASRVNATKQ